ncbi:SpoIID/LytB domain-containing protein [Alicyclobacillus tolerans]|uniref:Stage II sporulation protein n=2 Tax=Alicyclobacillus tolerans TaxID=90970 RepID=A0A1M6NPT5_9BACL|nr:MULTISPECIES: SpoIID/LytB domain-containing protein [Alicyclobacillus]MDP9727505.1 peptidoglycan hydrolase-like amidase [Alicyclobacillus tengchongensis]SHJ97723.1 Stage II sporulation protein [Alicyclobacillus montanus]
MYKPKLYISLMSLVGSLFFSTFAKPAVHAQVTYTITNTAKPSVIRVAIRENNPWGEPDPRGRILYVQTVPFDQYCRDVLPNEWIPSWSPEALKAGAMAVKMFAWYHHLHPITLDGFTFDVDNTVNFQTFRYLSNQPETDAALNAIKNLAYVQPDGTIIELNYRAGIPNNPNWQYRNAQKMAQWGSEYWAAKGQTYLQILQFYYMNRALRGY